VANYPELYMKSSAYRLPKLLSLLWIAPAFLAFFPNPNWALGYRIPNQDAEAIGRGNAFAATANNPSAIYYNPAGITQLEGHHIQIGSLFYLGMENDFKANDGSGRHTKTDYQVLPVPQLFYTYTPKNSPLSIGLGVYSPFGLALKWPENSGFRSAAIEGRMTYARINPVLAYQILPSLSISAGPTFNWSDTLLRNGLVNIQGLGDEFVFRGNNWSFGYNAGIRWQPHEKVAFGVTYRSSTTIDCQGYSKVNMPGVGILTSSSSAEIKYPQIVTAGISYRPTTNWNLEVNVDWADWNVVKALTFKNTPLGNQTLPLNWHSSWFYEAGVTRLFGRYYASLGYFFCENTTSEKFFTPVLPDTNLHVPSLGVGYKGEHWDFGLAGQLIFSGPAREVRSAVNPAVNGDYKWFLPTVTFSTGFHF
jgi:long-chain fatty acid transport protein